MVPRLIWILTGHGIIIHLTPPIANLLYYKDSLPRNQYRECEKKIIFWFFQKILEKNQQAVYTVFV